MWITALSSKQRCINNCQRVRAIHLPVLSLSPSSVHYQTYSKSIMSEKHSAVHYQWPLWKIFSMCFSEGCLCSDEQLFEHILNPSQNHSVARTPIHCSPMLEWMPRERNIKENVPLCSCIWLSEAKLPHGFICSNMR